MVPLSSALVRGRTADVRIALLIVATMTVMTSGALRYSARGIVFFKILNVVLSCYYFLEG